MSKPVLSPDDRWFMIHYDYPSIPLTRDYYHRAQLEFDSGNYIDSIRCLEVYIGRLSFQQQLTAAPLHLLASAHRLNGNYPASKECYSAAIRYGAEADWQMLVQGQIDYETTNATGQQQKQQQQQQQQKQHQQSNSNISTVLSIVQ